MNPTGPDVFGREREFGLLTAFVGESGVPGALVLEGEPGIGKTTLWNAAVADARKRGVRVLASSPASGETPLSFTVLTDLFAESLRSAGRELPNPQRNALEVALLLDEPIGEQPAQQRTVFAATLSLLRLLAEREPVLLAVDDIQWIDDASSDALAFATRRLGDARVSILCAKRSDPSDSATGKLEGALEQRHGSRLQRIALGPLSMSAVHNAIRERFGVTFAPSVMQRLHMTSGGNPFYALELARALTRRAVPLEPGGALPVPETLQQILGMRMDDLSPIAQELVAVVALLSQPTIAALEAAGVGGALDEAVRMGVLEQTGAERVRLAHPMFASTVSARLTPRLRR